MDTKMQEAAEYEVPDPSSMMRMTENEAYDINPNLPQLLPTVTLANDVKPLLQSLRQYE